MALAAADDHIFKYDGTLPLGAQADGLAVPQAEERTLRLGKMQMARRDDNALGKLDLTGRADEPAARRSGRFSGRCPRNMSWQGWS